MTEQKTLAWQQVIDPCKQVCILDPNSGLCMGCSRTQEEIDNWFLMTPEQKIAINQDLPTRG